MGSNAKRRELCFRCQTEVGQSQGKEQAFMHIKSGATRLLVGVRVDAQLLFTTNYDPNYLDLAQFDTRPDVDFTCQFLQELAVASCNVAHSENCNA